MCPLTHNQVFGKSGEDIAALFFEERGFQIIERNWRCRFGEIDLVIRKGGEWRFVEVKTRTSADFGYPEESVTCQKREHLFRATEVYCQMLNPRPQNVRVDVLAIILNQQIFDIKWIEDIC